MSHPLTRADFPQFAGKWTDANLDLDDFPDNTRFIVGREDKPHIPHTCILCYQTTNLDPRDEDVLKQGAVPICSSCYLNHLKKEQK